MKPFQDLQNHQPKKKHCGAYLEGELITSKAWFSMRSPSAYQIYCLFESMVVKKPVKGKKNEYSYPNARKLKLTYKQAWDSYGIEQSKFTHAVDELIAHGFIDIVLHGNASAREQTIYGICGGGKMTPKTPFCVVTLLAIAFALLFYIVWTFPWLKESLLRRLAGLLIVAACLYLFGDYVWPSTQNLNQSMTAKIETPKDEAKPVPKQDTTDQGRR